MECNYDDRFSGLQCHIKSVDLSKKNINEKFSFSGTKEEKENAIKIQFQEIGRVAHLPQNLVEEFPKLTQLSIQRSEIPIVKNNLLGPQFSQIKELHLESNQIKIIEDGAFKHLPNLEEVSLYDNKFKSLGAKVFENNSKLKVIWLQGNKIKIIAPETFRNLNQLKSIDFEGNECVGNEIGCFYCDTKIDHTELNRDLHACYENHKKSSDFLNEGENTKTLWTSVKVNSLACRTQILKASDDLSNKLTFIKISAH